MRTQQRPAGQGGSKLDKAKCNTRPPSTVLKPKKVNFSGQSDRTDVPRFEYRLPWIRLSQKERRA